MVVVVFAQRPSSIGSFEEIKLSQDSATINNITNSINDVYKNIGTGTKSDETNESINILHSNTMDPSRRLVAGLTDGLVPIRSHNIEGPVSLHKQGFLRSINSDTATTKIKKTGKKYKSLTINNNDNTYSKELMAIIHIGPHKTATTTIQALTAIIHNEIVQDGYEMPWALVAHDLLHVNAEPYVDINQYNFVSCMQDVKEMFPEAKCNPRLVEATKQIAIDKKQSVILTAEEFSRTDRVRIDRIYDTLANHYQRVRIVVYYRRFYEWLFSYWHQFAKFRRMVNRKSFPEYMDNLRIVQELHDSTYTMGCKNQYEKYFSDVVVYNMHDMGQYNDVSEMFFCEAVPNARNACEKVRQRNLKQNRHVEMNSYYPLVYEELAYHAETTFQLYNSTELNITLSHVTLLTRQRHEVELNLTQYDFHRNYVICPSKDSLQFLLNVTLYDEMTLFPIFYRSKKGERTIRQKFSKDAKTKLCFIDAQRIIENDYNGWKQFFISMSLDKR